MKNSAVILLLLSLIASLGYGQVKNGCITIDFENFPDGTAPFDGMTISNQYQAEFGLTFSLETGGFPRLAQVGGVTTAFQSSLGNDTPMPNQDIGEYFITDDGILSGTFSPPIILNFQFPIDSFAGCILDMDGGESFIIHARDEFDNIILADTIYDGDLGTGDGLATCWGFNLDGCEGSVYSIRYQGTRPSPSFGMGMDNFSFCYSGIRIQTQVEEVKCDQLGSILIESQTSEVYQFSMDGINFSENGLFENLDVGTYTLYILDENGCPANFPIDMTSEEPVIDNVFSSNTTCGEENGIMEVNVFPDNGATYSIDGTNFQESNIFTDLPADDYTVTIIDDNNCVLYAQITIDPSSAPGIDQVITADDECQKNIGSITIDPTITMSVYTFSIDGTNFQDTPFFDNLIEGTYEVTVKDEMNCTYSETVEILGTPAVTIEDVPISNATCERDNGSIEFVISGGVGPFQYSIDGVNFQDSELFDDIPSDTYSLVVTDSNGCSDTNFATIESPLQSFIDNVDYDDTRCDEDNGLISVLASPSTGVEYSLDGVEFQTSQYFEDLAPGDYTITIKDPNGCITTQEQSILPSVVPQIDDYDTAAEQCEKTNGSIAIFASGGTGNLSYSLNGNSFGNDSQFSNLSEGDYILYVQDEMGCIVEEPMVLEGTPVVNIASVEVTPPDCFINNAALEIRILGGTGELQISLNNGSLQTENIFTDLPDGNYEIYVVDDLGCESRKSVSVFMPTCDIYIPSVITANNDGDNDLFEIQTNGRYLANVLDYRIYDRWGNLVYLLEPFEIHNNKAKWWDGYFNDEPAVQGMYTYLIEILHPNGVTELFAGDLTLLR